MRYNSRSITITIDSKCTPKFNTLVYDKEATELHGDTIEMLLVSINPFIKKYNLVDADIKELLLIKQQIECLLTNATQILVKDKK